LQRPIRTETRRQEISDIRKVFGIVSGKGGVGKSLVTSLLAVLMQRKGYQTAILDADITGPSIPKAFGIQKKATGSETGIFPVKTHTDIEIMSLNLLVENETDPVVWRGPILANSVKQFWTEVIWNQVDIMFIDMPPGTGDVPLTVFQSIPIDGIIIVTSPQELVSMVVEKAIGMAKLMDVRVLGIVENYSYIDCPHCSERILLFGESQVAETAKRHHILHHTQIPLDTRLSTASDRGLIELFDGDWLNEISDMLEKMINA
jgi:Mrp family chromosome partitioning ATPase